MLSEFSLLPYSKSDFKRFMRDRPQHGALTYCELRAFQGHKETIGLFRRIAECAHCAILYGNPEIWRFGI